MIITDLEVYQANSFVESRQSYSVNEKRLLSTLISFVKPTDTEFIKYEVSVQEWAKLLGVSPKGLYQIADEVTTGLMMKIISIKDPIALKFDKWHVLDTAKYAEGILTLSIDKKMNNIFLQLKATKNYTHYELAEFLSLTSTHAQRIYELLKQYQHSKQRGRTIGLEALKDMLGIDEKQYKLFSDFRKKVLNISLKQIEEKTTLRYEWKAITKRGRKVDAIEFFNISVTGTKINPIQEKSFLESYLLESIYHPDFNIYLTIKAIEKGEDGKIIVVDRFDGVSYEYDNLSNFQENLVKAKINKSLF